MKKGDVILSTGIDPTEVIRRAGGPSHVREALGIASFPFNISAPEMVETFSVTRALRGR